VTATVESIPLIAASVISKKIAAGADVIVLDIKYGAGAFMHTLEDAKLLAFTCREVGSRLGRSISTVISAMNQPLGYSIGHSLEVLETVQLLRGEGAADLEQLCLRLAGVALVCAGVHPTLEEAELALKETLQNGKALEKFRELVVAQHGDPYFMQDSALLPQPEKILMIPSTHSGFISNIDAMEVAKAAKLVGAGRLTKDCPIDLGVGVVLRKRVGDEVRVGETLVELHAGESDAKEAMSVLKAAFSFSDSPVAPPALIEEVMLGEVYQSKAPA